MERVPAEDPAVIEKAATTALRAGKNRPPVAAAIEAVKSAVTLPFDEALARERAMFQTLRMGSEAAALRYLFFRRAAGGESRWAWKTSLRDPYPASASSAPAQWAQASRCVSPTQDLP